MVNQTYWAKRQEQLQNQLELDEEVLRKKLSESYDKQAKKLEKEIAYYYKTYGKDDVIQYRTLMLQLPDADKRLLIEEMDEFVRKYPQYKHLIPVRKSIYTLNRMEGMQHSIYMQQVEMGAIDQKELDNHLKKQYKNGYTAMANQLGSDVGGVNQEIIAKAINARWANGSNFSDSIWNNRKKLADYLNRDFAQAIARGDSYQRCMRELTGRFGKVSRRDMFRLVYTEGTYIMNEATITPFGVDFEEYQYSTMGDGKVCSICSGLAGSGTKFKIKDRQPGINFPPMHSCCRCSYTIVIPDNFADDYVAKHGGDKYTKGVDNTAKKGIINTGSRSGALNPIGKRASAHAVGYYALVRKMKTDYLKISENTGYEEEDIKQVKEYLFVDIHDLGEDGFKQFDPDYMIGESWKRLIDGKDIKPHDLTLLKHELEEQKLIAGGMSQYEAHIHATKKYDYDTEANEFYGNIEKYKKE